MRRHWKRVRPSGPWHPAFSRLIAPPWRRFADVDRAAGAAYRDLLTGLGAAAIQDRYSNPEDLAFIGSIESEEDARSGVGESTDPKSRVGKMKNGTTLLPYKCLARGAYGERRCDRGNAASGGSGRYHNDSQETPAETAGNPPQ